MFKSGPLEQMVLKAGDQPFSHLNLDSRAHHSLPGRDGKEFTQGKTGGSNLVRLAMVKSLYVWICKTEKIMSLSVSFGFRVFVI